MNVSDSEIVQSVLAGEGYGSAESAEEAQVGISFLFPATRAYTLLQFPHASQARLGHSSNHAGGAVEHLRYQRAG